MRRALSTAHTVAIFERELTAHTAARAVWHATAPRVRVTCAGLAPLVVDARWTPVDGLGALRAAGTSLGSEADPIIAARVNGSLCGLREPVGEALRDGSDAVDVDFVRLSSPGGAALFSHSAAHILGAAIEAHWPGALLLDGPAVDAGGFFYEAWLPGGARPSEEALAPLLAIARGLVAAKAPFQRLPVPRSAAAEAFKDNPFKLSLLQAIPHDVPVTLYRCGPFVDLCRGPHVPHTGVFKALRFTRGSSRSPPQGAPSAATAAALAAATHDTAPPLLHRVHGIAFPTPAQLTAWQRSSEEAATRDHRVVGRSQELFFFHDASPGCAFFLPHGTRIYNALVELLRGEYRMRGFEEVMTPLLYKRSLWETSGHLHAYAENMYAVTAGLERVAVAGGNDKAAKVAAAATTSASAAPLPIEVKVTSAAPLVDEGLSYDHGDGDEDEGFGLKPMNCPGHALIFAQRQVSYRELPMRIADFSALHRAEASGALGGLTRLRRFAQDDAHIFCTPAQVGEEVASTLEFVSSIYALFDFPFRLVLSTRPAKYVGDLSQWDAAEGALRDALRTFLASNSGGGGGGDGGGAHVTVVTDEGGGAFYGPKIDVFVRDAGGREHQCATVQLDFNLPIRFGLAYRSGNGVVEEKEDKGEESAPLMLQQQQLRSGFERPVMIHRAILGSLERFMGVLMEHTGGKWPFWISPRQLLLCTVSERTELYAHAVARALRFPDAPVGGAVAGDDGSHPHGSSGGGDRGSVLPRGRDTGLWVELDVSSRSVAKKVREGQLAAHNLLVVLGDAEAAAGTASVRFRDAPMHAAFMRAWAAVDGGGAAAAAATTAAGGAGSPGRAAPARGAAVAYNSPLVVLPIATLRAVCEHLRTSRMN